MAPLTAGCGEGCVKEAVRLADHTAAYRVDSLPCRLQVRSAGFEPAAFSLGS